jgi:hypothetical protein
MPAQTISMTLKKGTYAVFGTKISEMLQELRDF